MFCIHFPFYKYNNGTYTAKSNDGKDLKRPEDRFFMGRKIEYGDSARIWNTIKNWNMDIDNKLMKKDNKGYFISMVAMMLSLEQETIKMCMAAKTRKGSKWNTIVSKFSKNSLPA